MKPILGIFLGEAAGIGPEVIARLVANGTVQKYCRPLLIGDSRVLKLGQRIAGVDFPVSIISDAAAANWRTSIPTGSSWGRSIPLPARPPGTRSSKA